MTDIEILQKAIEKAEKNGFECEYIFKACLHYDEKTYTFDDGLEYMWHINRLIFSHNFAKAFFGEKLIGTINLSHPLNQSFGKHEFKKCWKHHLQQMVLCEEPLKYLEKFL